MQRVVSYLFISGQLVSEADGLLKSKETAIAILPPVPWRRLDLAIDEDRHALADLFLRELRQPGTALFGEFECNLRASASNGMIAFMLMLKRPNGYTDAFLPSSS